MSNRLAEETSPYLRQHGDNPVDWYPWGDDAFALARALDKPVFLSVGLLVVPLVPRHGPRVVRGPRDRGAHERAVREREGRPRGTPGRRRGLHAGGAGAHRPRRLAHERVVHPRRPPVLRRHVLPERGTARDAVVRARVRSGRGSVERTPRRSARARGSPHRGDRRAGDAARDAGRAVAATPARGLRQHRARSSSRSTAASAPRRSSRPR